MIGASRVPAVGLSDWGYPSLMVRPFKPRTSQDGGAIGPGTMQSRGILLPEPGLNLTAYLLRLGCVAVKTTIELRLGKDSNSTILSSSQLPWLSRSWLFLVVWVPNRSFVRKCADDDEKPRQLTSMENKVACYPLTRGSSIRF